MSEQATPSPDQGGEAISALEKLAEVRILVLILCALFFLDIWLLRAGVDPTSITLDTVLTRAKQAPVLTVLLFILSFSLLIGAVFPILRQLIGLARLYIFSSVTIGPNRTRARRRLSDWSLALVVFSVYDAVIGFFSDADYRGLALHLVSLNRIEGFESAALSLVALSFWAACWVLAVQADDPFDDA